MATITKTLSLEAKITLLTKVAESALTQFPNDLTDCIVATFCNSVDLKKITHHKGQQQVAGFFHPKYKPTEWDTIDYPAISLTLCGSNTLSIEAHPIGEDKRDYDNVALWIAGQLDKVFDHINIEINNTERIGVAIGWKCVYCNTQNTSKNCEHCGAPKVW